MSKKDDDLVLDDISEMEPNLDDIDDEEEDSDTENEEESSEENTDPSDESLTQDSSVHPTAST